MKEKRVKMKRFENKMCELLSGENKMWIQKSFSQGDKQKTKTNFVSQKVFFFLKLKKVFFFSKLN